MKSLRLYRDSTNDATLAPTKTIATKIVSINKNLSAPRRVCRNDTPSPPSVAPVSGVTFWIKTSIISRILEAI